MGIFRTTIAVAHVARLNERCTLARMAVDTSSGYDWIQPTALAKLGIVPARVDRLETADARVQAAPVGFALIYAGGRSAAAAVVFAEADGMILLGSHGLEGLKVRTDLGRKELVPAGPVLVATF